MFGECLTTSDCLICINGDIVCQVSDTTKVPLICCGVEDHLTFQHQLSFNTCPGVCSVTLDHIHIEVTSNSCRCITCDICGPLVVDRSVNCEVGQSRTITNKSNSGNCTTTIITSCDCDITNKVGICSCQCTS